MKPAYEVLWEALRERLLIRGDLPLRHELLTPAEIAEHVQRTRDDRRVTRFVRDYYYPRFYGRERGSLSDRDAAALVASFDTRSRGAAPSTTQTPRSLCVLCHRRPARGDGA